MGIIEVHTVRAMTYQSFWRDLYKRVFKSYLNRVASQDPAFVNQNPKIAKFLSYATSVNL